ncbi:hypothetical protein [Colwellia psychrerythraea]|uniref:Uncharacterized protein n=1 Tax=Colwellia psychrerythraea TaxID=28229 RepID=A0A099KHP4_COLPS|nr:hypothetical protein [Colwellia psychrerythraea]KGJ89517.1 hypothetical protein GAB14E_0710 [Colwellia psychrerythraea]
MEVEKNVQIKLCIGLVGICVLSIVGDECDGVHNDLLQIGAENWHDNLPEHDKPIEGIYSFSCNVHYSDDDITYEIIESMGES